jgi:hypothetical protein
MPGMSQTFCGSKLPLVMVASSRQYLIVRATGGPTLCTTPPSMVPHQPARHASAWPVFTAPAGAAFTNASKETFYSNGDVAATGINSNADAASVLAALSVQMVSAGWAQTNAASAPAAATFSKHDADGTVWIAVLSVTAYGTGKYIFTAAAFKGAETQSLASVGP